MKDLNCMKNCLRSSFNLLKVKSCVPPIVGPTDFWGRNTDALYKAIFVHELLVLDGWYLRALAAVLDFLYTGGQWA